jgi:glycosyltransferase involved in cell wall biosynthesis
MVKVCHVISGYYRNDTRIFLRQCKSLSKYSYDVSILANDGLGYEVIDDISIYSTEKIWKRGAFLFLFAKYQFKKAALKINADIYQIHSPELIMLGLYLKKKGKTVIYDAHEDMPNHILEKEWIPLYFRKIVSVIVSNYMNYSLRVFDEIVSPHSHVVNYFNKRGLRATSIANFPLVNQIDDLTFEKYISNSNLLCYSGTVYSYSNQEYILEAMEDLPNVHYQIAGYFDETYFESLKKYNSFSRLKLLGRISHLDLREFYRSSLIGIVIYDYKLNLGFDLGSYGTNKIFEYMEAGLPIICTNFILWKAIVDKYDCGICVEPNNSQQITLAIKFLLEDKSRSFEMGQNGKKAVISEFNWEVEERKYIKLFDKYKISLTQSIDEISK